MLIYDKFCLWSPSEILIVCDDIFTRVGGTMWSQVTSLYGHMVTWSHGHMVVEVQSCGGGGLFQFVSRKDVITSWIFHSIFWHFYSSWLICIFSFYTNFTVTSQKCIILLNNPQLCSSLLNTAEEELPCISYFLEFFPGVGFSLPWTELS